MNESTNGPRQGLERASIEGVAVLLAILAAFSLEAWWEGRSEASQTEALVSALEVEWAAEESVLGAHVERLGVNHAAVIALLRAHSTGTLLPIESAKQLWADLAWVTYKPALGALNSLLVSGLDGVSDVPLRTAIAAWPAR